MRPGCRSDAWTADRRCSFLLSQWFARFHRIIVQYFEQGCQVVFDFLGIFSEPRQNHISVLSQFHQPCSNPQFSDGERRSVLDFKDFHFCIGNRFFN